MGFFKIVTGVYLCLIAFMIGVCSCVHLQGDWSTSEFFKFLTKFGFQKTNINDRVNTQGYIFGNITVSSINMNGNSSVDNGYTLVVVDKEYFKNYYGNSTLPSHETACLKMFSEIKEIAFDSKCNPNGLEDFLRKVPCEKNKHCVDEDAPERVIPHHQFSYRVQDINQPRFWYLSLVACSRDQKFSDKDASCLWHWNPQNITIHYDIWLVNGNPYTKHMNPLEYQFSFHVIDIVEIYIVCFIIYSVLTITVGVFILKRQKHHLIKIFFTCLCLELVSVILHLIHMLKFSVDGEGEHLVRTVAMVVTNVAQCLFVLLLLLIAKGWTITSKELTNKLMLFITWLVYVAASLFLVVWNQTEVDEVSDVDEYQTWPGYLLLATRLLMTVAFLLHLRLTFKRELRAGDASKLHFYLHFGAGFCVWFCYLPVVALIAAQVSALWRTKLLLGISSAANLLYYAVLTHLLWPSRSDSYFQLKPATAGPTAVTTTGPSPHLVEYVDDDDLEDYEKDRITVDNT